MQQLLIYTASGRHCTICSLREHVVAACLISSEAVCEAHSNVSDAVPEANYVTAYWVELSEAEGKPVRELGHTRVTCSPLPYSLPLPGMTAVR